MLLLMMMYKHCIVLLFRFIFSLSLANDIVDVVDDDEHFRYNPLDNQII